MKRYSLKSYSLIDNDKNHEYTTGVSLADCTIPFEDLLNKQDKEINFYQGKYRKMRQELKSLKEDNKNLSSDLDKISDFLMEEFDIDIQDILEG